MPCVATRYHSQKGGTVVASPLPFWRKIEHPAVLVLAAVSAIPTAATRFFSGGRDRHPSCRETPLNKRLFSHEGKSSEPPLCLLFVLLWNEVLCKLPKIAKILLERVLTWAELPTLLAEVGNCRRPRRLRRLALCTWPPLSSYPSTLRPGPLFLSVCVMTSQCVRRRCRRRHRSPCPCADDGARLIERGRAKSGRKRRRKSSTMGAEIAAVLAASRAAFLSDHRSRRISRTSFSRHWKKEKEEELRQNRAIVAKLNR